MKDGTYHTDEPKDHGATTGHHKGVKLQGFPCTGLRRDVFFCFSSAEGCRGANMHA